MAARKDRAAPAEAEPAAPAGATPKPEEQLLVSSGNAEIEFVPLYEQVSAAALAAQRAGQHAAHAALHGIEVHLGALRQQVAQAKPVLQAEHGDILTRLTSIL